MLTDKEEDEPVFSLLIDAVCSMENGIDLFASLRRKFCCWAMIVGRII
jgi:hypothetical protein